MKTPRKCIFCMNFPCLDKDGDATVVTELKGDYPFISERDELKFCNGEEFESIFDVILREEIRDAMATPFVPIQGELLTTVTPDTEKKAFVLKATTSDRLQLMIDKITMSEDVVSFDIKGLASTYDSDSGSTHIVVILMVDYKKEVDDDNSEEVRDEVPKG